MSAWKTDFTDAPRESTQFLIMDDNWSCPAVAHYCLDAETFIFSEEALSEIDGGVIDIEGCRWAPMPV